MAIAFRAVGSAVTTAGATTLSPVVPATARVGDLLVVVVSVAAASTGFTASISGGSTFTAQDTTTGSSTVTGWLTVAAASADIGGTVSVNWTTSGVAAAAVIVYSGVDDTSPMPLDSKGSSTTTTVAYGTLQVPINGMILAVAGINSAKTLGTPSGYTNRLSNTTRQGLGINDLAVTTGSHAETSTAGTTANNAGALISMRPAPVPVVRGFVDEAGVATGATTATSAATQVGDVHIAIAEVSTASTITTPTGWSQILNTTFNTGANQFAVYWKKSTVAGTENITWTFTGGGTLTSHSITWANADSATFADASGSQANASSTSVTAPTITETKAYDTLLFCGAATATRTWTVPTGMTAVTATATKLTFTAQEGEGAAVATGTRVGTINSTSVNIGALVAIMSVQNVPTVNSARHTFTGSVTSLTVNAPGVISNNDLLVTTLMATNTLGAITPPSGWALLTSDTTTNPKYYIYTKNASSEGSTYSWTWGSGSGNMVAAVCAISNAVATADVYGATSTATNVTITYPTETPTISGSGELVMFLGATLSGGTCTAPTGSMQVSAENASSVTLQFSWEEQSANSATGSRTSTAANASNNTGITLVITGSRVVSGLTAVAGTSALGVTGSATASRQQFIVGGVDFGHAVIGDRTVNKIGPFVVSGTTYVFAWNATTTGTILQMFKSTNPTNSSSWTSPAAPMYFAETWSLTNSSTFGQAYIQSCDGLVSGTNIYVSVGLAMSRNDLQAKGVFLYYLRYDTTTDTWTRVYLGNLSTNTNFTTVPAVVGRRSGGAIVLGYAYVDGSNIPHAEYVVITSDVAGSPVTITPSGTLVALTINSVLIDESNNAVFFMEKQIASIVSMVASIYNSSNVAVDAATVSNHAPSPSSRMNGIPTLYGAAGSKKVGIPYGDGAYAASLNPPSLWVYGGTQGSTSGWTNDTVYAGVVSPYILGMSSSGTSYSTDNPAALLPDTNGTRYYLMWVNGSITGGTLDGKMFMASKDGGGWEDTPTLVRNPSAANSISYMSADWAATSNMIGVVIMDNGVLTYFEFSKGRSIVTDRMRRNSLLRR